VIRLYTESEALHIGFDLHKLDWFHDGIAVHTVFDMS